MKRLLLILPLLAFLLACDKDDDNDHKNGLPPDGVYTGTFQRQTGGQNDAVANVSLSFTAASFNGQSDLQRYPAICNGSFHTTGDSAHFENACVFTADFDWTLILKGGYDVLVIGDQLIMTKTYANQVKDVYNLRKSGSN